MNERLEGAEIRMESYLRECVEIDQLALSSEYERMPSDFAFWNERYAQAYQHWDQRVIARKSLYASLYMEARRAPVIPPAKALTVEDVKMTVESELVYMKALSDESQAEFEKVRLFGIMESLRTKREMLVSLGATIRQELQNDPVLRERARQEREVQANQRLHSASTPNQLPNL